MVSSLLDIGIKSLDHLASSARKRRRSLARPHHALSAYPCLQALLIEAERSGSIEAERQRLMQRRLAA